MLPRCLAFLALIVGLPHDGEIQDPPWLKVEIAMAGEGFMCPFLTPMFLEILEEKGADWVHCRRAESEIAFCVPLDKAQDQGTYTHWLTGLGYQEAHITYLQFDTLQVQPPKPLEP